MGVMSLASHQQQPKPKKRKEPKKEGQPEHKCHVIDSIS